MFKISIIGALIVSSMTTFSLASTTSFAASATELAFSQQIIDNKTTRSACLIKKDHIWDEATKRCIHVPRGSY